MGSGGTFYTIRDDKSRSADELLEQMSNYDKKLKEDEAKRRKKQAERESGGDDAAAVYRAAHFFCSAPLSKTIIPKNQFTRGEIESHKENCPHCRKAELEKKEAYQSEVDGRLRLRGCIGQLWSAIRDIQYAQERRKEIENKRKQWQQITQEEYHKLYLIEYDAGVAESRTLKRERLELHKLLYHPNEITRRAAREEFNKLKIDELEEFVQKKLGKSLLFEPGELEREEKLADPWYIHNHSPSEL